ncbi:MAG: hypothetical protein C4534_08215 [Gaiellales bacterium]|nr:MAG: hypothetical protein C4534_08215 [Gaiellales bacterium]
MWAPLSGANQVIRPSATGLTPADLPGLLAWVDASQIVGLVNNDPVVQWDDLSGNGYHATQSTASKRPKYQTNVQNGMPGVKADGVDDEMQFNNLGTQFAGSVGTAYFIFKLNSQAQWSAAGFTTLGVDIWWRYAGGGNQGYMGPLRQTRLNGQPATMPTIGAYIAVLTSDAAKYYYHENGVTRIDTVKNWGICTNPRLFRDEETNRAPFGGWMLEVAIYNQAHSDPDRRSLEAALGAKWGIAVV